MYLTTNNKIKTKNKLKLQILKELTKNSKDLYNKALYKVRQHFFENKEYLPYKKLYPLMKTEPEYTRLPSNASQQTLKAVDNAFKSFFNALKAKKQGKNNNKVKIPGYLDKNGYYKVIYTKIHLKREGNYIRLSLPKYIKEKYNTRYLYFKIPKHIQDKDIKEIHILPSKPYYKMSFIYDSGFTIKPTDKFNIQIDNIMSIDLGLNNLATIVTRLSKPIIIDGKSLKSSNRYFNKRISVLQSMITKGLDMKSAKAKKLLKQSKVLNRWYERRLNYIKDYLHKAATLIINKALKENIKLIIIGYNKGWKNEIDLGKTTEGFMNIPHLKLVDYIEYRAKLYGIKTVRQEESYTSKADALALDYIPSYKKDEEDKSNYKFSGKRILRGLYQSSIGKLINADINGALNIMRKYFQNLSVACDSLIREITGRGLVFQPVRVYIHPYKSSYKGSSLYNS